MSHPIRFGIQTSQQNVEWGSMLDLWKKAEGWGYDSLWNFDHFYPIFVDPNGPCLEGWTTLAALGQATSRQDDGRIGTLDSAGDLTAEIGVVAITNLKVKGFANLGLVLGGQAARLPNTLCVSFGGLDADAVLTRLERAGVVASSGAACSAGGTQPSHVLLAMGESAAHALGGVRFSLGRDTTEAEVDAVLDAVARTVVPLIEPQPLAA